MSEAHQLTGFLPKIPKTKHSAAYKIFHYPFLCKIAQMHLQSTEVLLQAGSYTTGNAAEDRALATQPVDVQLTIAAMVGYHSEGASITITNPQDAATIYLIIKQHLDDWFDATAQSMHRVEAPGKDLENLDNLAGEIYPYARYFLTEKPFHGQLVNRLQALLAQRGGLGRTSRLDRLQQQKEQRDVKPTQHTPMADAIQQNVATRRKAWQ